MQKNQQTYKHKTKTKQKNRKKNKTKKTKLTLYSFYLQLENIDIYRICQVGIKKNSHF